VNLKFVEAFSWAVSLKSVTRAAEMLHITQSALSSRIAALEAELGVVLLDRRDRQFRLTMAGQRFHAMAVEMLDLQRRMKDEMGGKSTRPMALRIGAIESVVHSWLTEWLQKMREHQPDFELELTVETSPVLVDQVRRGAQDLVFTALPAAAIGVRTRMLPAMPMSFVGHRGLPARRRYDLAGIGAHPLLTFQRGSHPHQALLQMFEDAGLPKPRVHAISSISAMVQLVDQGFGIATLPHAAATRLSDRLALKILPCSVPLADLPIHASFREDPGMHLTEAVLESAIDFVDSAPTSRTRTTGASSGKPRLRPVTRKR